MKKIFVTGIGTNVGKTVVSAILTKALQADYWKPVQAGDLDNTDTMKVKKWLNNEACIFHPETYRLTQPMSPHAAAEIDNITINLQDFVLPASKNTLVIEGAGGVLVPLSHHLLIADLIKHLKTSVVVVSRHYLGSINHTLLTIAELKRRKIPIIGIVFNGEKNEASEDIILSQTAVPLLFRVDEEQLLSNKVIERYSDLLKKALDSKSFHPLVDAL